MSDTTLEKELAKARHKLLDMGTRSRLVHVNRANQRANCLNIIDGCSDDIFGILRIEMLKMRFKAMGKDENTDNQEISLARIDEDLIPVDERHKDNILKTSLGPDALERRLLRLAASAKTAEEEQGLNILYLSLGFLRWKENTSSEIVREAPLILLPIEFVRNKRTSTYNIRAREDEMTTNLSLKARLHHDFGVTLPEINETDEWRPSSYFAEVKAAISGQSSWEIDEDGIQLGFFSFAKILMRRDLEPSSWPNNSLVRNDLLMNLFQGLEAVEPIFGDGDNDKLDQLLTPADIIQVIDADASQTKVIEEVRKGSNLVVQGPPGTGKSQTITNIIAAAVHDHKSVLFVAEKMAALSVVHKRLANAGLQDICLELHSRRANKKDLVQDLKRTLDNSKNATHPVGSTRKLQNVRDKLNEITELLHKPMSENNESLFQTMSEIIGFIGGKKKPPKILDNGLEGLSNDERSHVCDSINRFTNALSRNRSRQENPYFGTTKMNLSPIDLDRLKEELLEALHAIAEFQAETKKLSKRLRRNTSMSVIESFALADSIMELASVPGEASERTPVLYQHSGDPRMREALMAGRDWMHERKDADDIFVVAAWSADISKIRPAIMRGCSSFLSRWFGNYRRSCQDFATLLSGSLPKSPTERLALADQLLEVQERRQRLREEESKLESTLGNLWRGERTAFAELLEFCEWLDKMKSSNGFATAEEIVIALQKISDPISSADSLRTVTDKVSEKANAPVLRLGLDLEKIGIGKELKTASLDDLRNLFERMHNSMETSKNPFF